MKVGIDNVLISRMKELSDRFPQRYLSKREYDVYQSLPQERKHDFLAGRFAAKEAFVKASGQKDVQYETVEILDDAFGKPHLYVKGEEFGIVSITHDYVATAIVIIED